MTEDYSRLIYLFTDLILPLIVGYSAHQFNLIKEEWINKLIRFNVRIIFTLLSLLSFWVLPISWELAWLPVFGVYYVLFPGALAWLLFVKKYNNPLQQGAYMMTTMQPNTGTLCGICAFILYQEQGFAYSQIVASVGNILMILVCFPLAHYYHEKHHTKKLEKKSHWQTFRERFLNLNQVSLIGMVMGIIFNVNDVPRPEFLSIMFPWLVHIGAWIGFIPVGALIDFRYTKLYYERIINLIPLRFIIMPLVTLFSASLVIRDAIMINSLLVFSIAPSGINAVLISRLYGLTVNLATAAFILTTTIFLLIAFPVLFFMIQ